MIKKPQICYTTYYEITAMCEFFINFPTSKKNFLSSLNFICNYQCHSLYILEGIGQNVNHLKSLPHEDLQNQ